MNNPVLPPRPPDKVQQRRAPDRGADQFVDQRAETSDRPVGIGIWAPERDLARAAIQGPGKFLEGCHEANMTELGDFAAEINLMIVHVLTEPPRPRHHDRYQSALPGVRDRSGSPVAHDDFSVVKKLCQLPSVEKIG
jgi:hypothetical protein